MLDHSRWEIVTSKQPDRWSEVLEEIGNYTYYHLPAFHRLAEIRSGVMVAMPVFREGSYVMAFPMMIRSIDMPPEIDAAKGYIDAASAPGLIGPLVSSNTVPEDVRQGLLKQMHSFFEEQHILSVYGRLSTFADQVGFLRGYGETREQGIEVSLNLTRPPEEQFSSYISNHRRQIHKLRKSGFICEPGGMEYLDQFIDIYYDTMDRVGATKIFYYERSYFEFLLTEMADRTRFLVCKDGNDIAAIGLFVQCNGIVHYLYGGTAPGYLPQSPSKMLLDSAREWGNELGAHTFHLGGSPDPRGPLYQFKMGFGGREHIYSTWRYVVNQPVYDELCHQVAQYAGKEPGDSYFPAYRDPNLHLTDMR